MGVKVIGSWNCQMGKNGGCLKTCFCADMDVFCLFFTGKWDHQLRWNFVPACYTYCMWVGYRLLGTVIHHLVKNCGCSKTCFCVVKDVFFVREKKDHDETFFSLYIFEKVIGFLDLSYFFWKENVGRSKSCFSAVNDLFCKLFMGKRDHRSRYILIFPVPYMLEKVMATWNFHLYYSKKMGAVYKPAIVQLRTSIVGV